MGKTFSVSAGRMDDADVGFMGGQRSVYYHGIELRTRWGHSYVHRHRFPGTEDGLTRAERLAARVEDFVARNGVDRLNLDHWYVRTIYGTDAYVAEEPALVERECADDAGGV